MGQAQHLGRTLSSPRAVGVLASDQHPLLPYLLDQIDRVPEVEALVILDEKAFTARDAGVFAERTEGAFPERSQRDALAGRRHVLVPSHNDPELLAWMSDEGVDLLANGGTPRLIGSALLDAAPVVNAHPGLLPKYRGASCCEWALLAGDPVGVSVHFMDAGLDSGPIVLTEELAIQPAWRYVDIRVALYRLSLAALARGLGEVVARSLTPDALPPQPAGGTVHKPMPAEMLATLRSRIDGRGDPATLRPSRP